MTRKCISGFKNNLQNFGFFINLTYERLIFKTQLKFSWLYIGHKEMLENIPAYVATKIKRKNIVLMFSYLPFLELL